MERKARLLATAIGGCFTRAAARGAGYAPGEIRGKLGRGDWLVVRAGIYALSSTPAGLARDTAAAVIAHGPGAAATFEGAAALHKLPLVGIRTPQPRTTRPSPGRTPRLSGPSMSMAAGLPAHHVVEVDGIPASSIARTVVDLSRRFGFVTGVPAADAALRSGLSRKELERVIRDCRHWPKLRIARQVVEFADPRAETPIESLGRVRIHQSGLHLPELQIWLGEQEDELVRVDALYREERTVIEFDGRGKYADPMVIEGERARDELLHELGYVVVHLSWRSLWRGETVRPRIERAFARAARRRAAA